MRPRLPDFRRRPLAWLTAGAALLVAPKCLLCVLGYIGLGAGLALGGREICGTSPDPAFVETAQTALAFAGIVLIGLGAWAFRARRS